MEPVKALNILQLLEESGNRHPVDSELSTIEPEVQYPPNLCRSATLFEVVRI